MPEEDLPTLQRLQVEKMEEQEVPAPIEEEIGVEDDVQEVQLETQLQVEQIINILTKMNFKELASLEITICQEPVQLETAPILESTQIVQMHLQPSVMRWRLVDPKTKLINVRYVRSIPAIQRINLQQIMSL